MSGTLVYDGSCGFCTASVGLVPALRLSAGEVVPWQQADLAALGLTADQCRRAVQWVAPDGAVSAGAAAVTGLMLASGLPWRLLGAALRLPPLRWLADAGYRLVAANRSRLPGGPPACGPADRGPGPGPAG